METGGQPAKDGQIVRPVSLFFVAMAAAAGTARAAQPVEISLQSHSLLQVAYFCLKPVSIHS